MGHHKRIVPTADPNAGPHVVHQFQFVDVPAMNALTDALKGVVTVAAADVGMVARVGAAAPYDFFVLTDHTVPTWEILNGFLGGGALTFPATTPDTAITLDADDDHAVIRTTAGTTITVTVPTLAQGTRVLIVQEGAGQVQLSASGVTLQFPATFLARCAEQDSMIELLYLTTTLVQVVGDMELA